MAAQLQLGFHYSSSSHLHLAETTPVERNHNGLNPMQTPDIVDDDDSWEVRAFAEDTANVMGTTWPPRSYTCTYCRREFRSAQALGGHMNVHRRDRARLHQAGPLNAIKPSSSSSSTSNSFIIPTPDFNGGGSLCLLYHFPNPNIINGEIGINNSPSSNVNAYIPAPSSLFSMSNNHSLNNFMSSTTSSSTAISMNDHRSGSSSTTNFSQLCFGDEQIKLLENGNQELDLELRLGHGPTSTQTLMEMEKEHKISNLEAACLRKRSSD